ncbi:hypothetical protein MN608_08059 [Microdochium nivale]|nr:hypothetical protein MN608_08059 [Microdochium nivale]
MGSRHELGNIGFEMPDPVDLNRAPTGLTASSARLVVRPSAPSSYEYWFSAGEAMTVVIVIAHTTHKRMLQGTIHGSEMPFAFVTSIFVRTVGISHCSKLSRDCFNEVQRRTSGAWEQKKSHRNAPFCTVR